MGQCIGFYFGVQHGVNPIFAWYTIRNIKKLIFFKFYADDIYLPIKSTDFL